MWKPFKPPAFKSCLQESFIKQPERLIVIKDSDDESEFKAPPPKRRRVIHIVEENQPSVPKASTNPTAVNAPRKPLLTVKNGVTPTKASESPEGYFLVLWRKFTMKKHKTWDGDGVLAVRNGYAHLQDISGRDMGKLAYKEALLPGSILSIGGKEVEIDAVISKQDFLSGKPFLNSTKATASTPPPKTNLQEKLKMEFKHEGLSSNSSVPPRKFYAPLPSSTAIKSSFKNPLLAKTVVPKCVAGQPTPRHDPNATGALVMMRPKSCPKGKQIVDVVLDPFLGQWLRDHQREGIKFMYECVMGMRPFDGQGAILADEMGLGKTFQTIALLWTLLKQNPIAGSDGCIKKALIVCPVTLIVNWQKEFRKWLGNERLGVFVADGQKIRLTDFTHGRSYSVMIIGYEKLRSVQEDLKKGAGIDIVIADEGHRLKTAKNKSAEAIKNLDTPRRVILSGTPMQNDLSEFFVMVDFVNPGVLGNYNSFKKNFETPIVKSRQPGASVKEIELGHARNEELASLTKMFILRRTSEILAKYLPPKTEYVLFCSPTKAQADAYQHVLDSPVFGKVLGSPEASLQLITILKKVCNTPALLSKDDKKEPSNSNFATLLGSIPTTVSHMNFVVSSGKFRVLDRLIKNLSKTTEEKIVLVSNYTLTLDLLQQHLASLSLPFLRLDGSTPSAKRQGLVDTFNRTKASKCFAFLLSAKSGGAGINLIGASRLVLFDVDWNPATDLQAMARIHRDGQKRPVKIYRMLMAGGMDEKIYQRQVTKMGLADSVVDGKKNEASFTPEELRDLFRLNIEAVCQTHDLLQCDCEGLGREVPPSSLLESEYTTTTMDTDEEDEDDELSLPLNPGTMRASQVNMAEQERKICEAAARKRQGLNKGKMQALMQYRHIDAALFSADSLDVFGLPTEKTEVAKEAIDDEVLLHVMQEPNCKVSYVFAKRNG